MNLSTLLIGVAVVDDDSFTLAGVKFQVFSGYRIDDAMMSCFKTNYMPMFFTELAWLISMYPEQQVLSSGDFLTPSVRVLGHDTNGSFAMFLHSANYLNKISGLEEALSKGLLGGSAEFPRSDVGHYLSDHDRWTRVIRNPLVLNHEFDVASFSKSDLYEALCMGRANSGFLERYCSAGRIKVELGSFEKKPTARFIAMKKEEDGSIEIYAPSLLHPCSILGFKE